MIQKVKQEYYQSEFQSSTGSKDKITRTPLMELTIIRAKQLKCGYTHIGSYLKLKIKIVMFSFVSELICSDHEGQQVLVLVQNFPYNGRPYKGYFYQGRTLYIKEPFMKNTMQIIQVDDANDIQFEKRNVSSEEYRKQGKDLVTKGMYFEAYCLYTDALKSVKDPKQQLAFLLNKAIMCLKLNLKEEYQQNAKRALEIDPLNEKAHFHLIKCEIIRTNNLAKDKFDRLRLKVQENTVLQAQSKQELQKFISFHESFQTNTKVNWFDVILNKEVGEYFGPTVKLGKSKFGRGMFATKDIRPGQIIAIEHPSIFSIRDANQQNECECVRIDFVRFFIWSQEIRNRIHNLYLTSNKPKQNGVDGLTNEDISNLSRKSSFHCSPSISSIYKLDKSKTETTVLYQKCHLFNHSCDSKCRSVYFGSSIVIYAIQQIKAKQQIFISYVTGDYESRTKKLEFWNIKCDCTMCDEQRRELNGQKNVKYTSKRHRYHSLLYSGFEKMEKNWKSLSRKLLEDVKDMVDLEVVEILYKVSHGLEIVGDEMFMKIFPMKASQAKQLRQLCRPKDIREIFGHDFSKPVF